MAIGLRVTKSDGSLLFDTNEQLFGLVKSGYMTYLEQWRRKIRPYINSNEWEDSPLYYDNLYGFTVNAAAPVVFIVGQGCFTTTTRNGNDHTFYFSHASASTKYYVFDLMRDAGSGYGLKVRDNAANVLFNSEQIPLNVISAVTPPAVPTTDWGTWGPKKTYIGGNTYWQGGASFTGVCDYVHALTPGVEYAAHMPWSRAAQCWPPFTVNETYAFSVDEWCFGGNGRVTFTFRVTPGAYLNEMPGHSDTTVHFSNVPTLLPTVLVIETQNLPFPFSI